MDAIKGFVGRLDLGVACMLLMVFPTCFLVFHGLIIAGVLPRDIVWGGRLTDATFLPLEMLAVALNLLLIASGGVAARIVTMAAIVKLVGGIKWFLFYFVVVNTIAALFSTTTLEVLMTPVTAIYAVCLYRISAFADGLGAAT